MKDSFSENFSFHMIQIDMVSQSYRISIRILFIIIKMEIMYISKNSFLSLLF
jgi:hypothetical protein